MTRKENLLIEIYNLRNQISEIKGNTLVNIEFLEQMRDTLFSYAEEEANIQKKVRDLDALVKNPTRA